MLRIIDESKEIDMTAKFEVGQEVVVTEIQSYRKGVVAEIGVLANEKKTTFSYVVEMYVGKNSSSKFRRYPEHEVHATVREALMALSEKAEEAEKRRAERAAKKAPKNVPEAEEESASPETAAE